MMKLARLVGFASFCLGPLSWGATAGPTDRFVPLVQDGGGWTTELTIVNLSGHAAEVSVVFLTAAGYRELWPIRLQTSAGRAWHNEVAAALDPGGVLVIRSEGGADTVTRGFAEIFGASPDTQLGAYARVVRTVDGQVVQTLAVPYSPANERHSRLPLDLTNSAVAELVWVSMTHLPQVDLTFRDRTGRTVLDEQVTFDERTQLFLNVLERWPQLAGFAGTVEWNVTYPSAGFYEQRTFAAVSLWSRDAGVIFAIPGMTLPEDQDTTNPYN